MALAPLSVTATSRPLRRTDRLARLHPQIAPRSRALGPAPTCQDWLNGAPVPAARVRRQPDLGVIQSDGARIGAIRSLRQPQELARLAAVTKPPADASLH